jgi:hypothetical protein
MAHALSNVGPVRGLSDTLVNVLIKEYQFVAQHYFVWCQCKESKLNAGVSACIPDQSRTYKTKARLSLAGFAELRGNFELAPLAACQCQLLSGVSQTCKVSISTFFSRTKRDGE